MLEVKKLSVSYGGHMALEDLSFSVDEGQWLMLAGPNGAGKSTAVRAVSQAVEYSGTICLDGQDIKKISPQARARAIGVLNQNNSVSYPFSVSEVVGMGRYSHSRGFLSGRSGRDAEAVLSALRITGTEELSERSVLELSGGELQRVFLAQVFAQEPRLLLLDEPANHLDLVYQKQVFELVARWLRQPGRAAVSVVHDLSLAKAFGSHALLLDHGKCVASGEAQRVLCPENLDRVYGIDVSGWMKRMLEQWT